MSTSRKNPKAAPMQKQLPQKLYLPILAFATEIIFSALQAPPWMTFSIEYLLIIAFIFYNIKAKSSWPYWIGAGTLMNFTVIAANKFTMPVSPSVFSPQVDNALLESLIQGDIYGYSLSGADTVLPFLGDIIGISPFGELIGFASIGDLLLLGGAAIAVYRIR